MALAMYEKECETDELVRRIRMDIINFSGFVTKKYEGKDVHPIPIIDNANMVMHIKNIDQALSLLKEFK